MDNRLLEARRIINEVDREMAELFCQRMRAAEIIAQYKREHGLEILDADREKEIIERGAERVDDPTLREYYVNFLKDTMKLSRSYQLRLNEGMRVAFSGTEGAFAHIAACRLFPTAKKLAYPNFESAYKAVEGGECDCAVLPLENSFNGEVGQVSDLIFSGTLYVNGVKDVSITQDLLGVPGTRIEDVREVVSHPQALGQCHEYIAKHGFTQKEYTNTALAAKYVKEKGEKSIAAIASAEAAEILGLCVLEKGINTSAGNTTRFAILSRAENTPSDTTAKTTTLLFFTVRNEAGALAQAIDVIGRHGFNMRSIRSRPMKELLWQYYFYVEAEGNLNTDEGRAMLTELSEFCDRLRPAGTFIKN